MRAPAGRLVGDEREFSGAIKKAVTIRKSARLKRTSELSLTSCLRAGILSSCMEPEFEPKHPGGRPTKRTPEITEQICEGISYGLRDEEVAAMVGIDDSTLTCWKSRQILDGRSLVNP